MTSNDCGGMLSPEEGVAEATKRRLFREKLYQEEPKMDAAIKSYCSWLLAQQHQTLIVQQQRLNDADAEDEDGSVVTTQTTHQQHTWEMTEVLGLARKLSKSINAYVFDIKLDESTERSIVAQVWNEVAAMSVTKNNSNNNNDSSTNSSTPRSSTTGGGVRITKMLGQTALMYAWKDLDRMDLVPIANSQEEQHESSARLFLETFERFLFAKNTTTTTIETATAAADSSLSCCSSTSVSSTTVFNDAQLIWSPDGGKKELCRRATQRQKVALERRLAEEESSQRLQRLLQLQQQEQATSGSTPTITIIEEGEEEKDS